MLAAAALALPGIAGSARAEEQDGLSLQYGRYLEGERDLQGVDSLYRPIEVDSLSARGRFSLSGRTALALEYVQDTWSGATPVTTAPRVVAGNRPTSLDGVSGATPYINGELYLDGNFSPLVMDSLGQVIGVDSRLVHTLSSASPETRKQGSFEIGREWDSAAATLGGGVSAEDDYTSLFASVGGRIDLNRRNTSLSAKLSLAGSETHARLDHDAVPYIDVSAFRSHVEVSPGERELRDSRSDISLQLGASQILGRNSIAELTASVSHSQGYLGNPYKVVEVAFIDPQEQFQAPPGGYYARVQALLERRPDERDQLGIGARLSHYVRRFDAALHLGYRFFLDDWGIHAHTLEASWAQPLAMGWLVVPRLRFYSQSRADFYAPYLISPQAFRTIVSDPDTGDILSITPFDHRLLPGSYSSDARLSGFGAISAGITLRKTLARGITFELDLEYYRHAGRLKLGGGGERDYADYDSLLASAAIRLDPGALHARRYRGHRESGQHGGPAAHAIWVPAGMMFEHVLQRAGQAMLGYRYMFARQSGSMLNGTSSAGDAEVVLRGCEGSACRTVPERMHMHMHMLELMWAPTDRLTLMLMPQLVDMNMDVRPLAGAPPDIHSDHEHSTGGIGDILAVGMFRLLDGKTHHLHGGIGVSVPTGDVDLRLRRTHQQDRGLTHYGMQLGSGTWDLLPSLTWTGQTDRWSWGAQASAVLRMQQQNESGYRLGNNWEVTAWAGPRLTHWLAAFGRLSHRVQGSIQGEYEDLHADSGPMDFPANYGARAWDAGLGLSLVVPHGYLEGNQLRLEWLQPLHEDVDGYQLERRGRLHASWSVHF